MYTLCRSRGCPYFHSLYRLSESWHLWLSTCRDFFFRLACGLKDGIRSCWIAEALACWKIITSTYGLPRPQVSGGCKHTSCCGWRPGVRVCTHSHVRVCDVTVALRGVRTFFEVGGNSTFSNRYLWGPRTVYKSASALWLISSGFYITFSVYFRNGISRFPSRKVSLWLFRITDWWMFWEILMCNHWLQRLRQVAVSGWTVR